VKGQIIFIITCIILALSAGAMSQTPMNTDNAEANETEPVIVGSILLFTGAHADIASEEKNAIEMALNDTDRPFELIYADSAGINDQAKSVFHELVEEDNASIIITCGSWISNCIYPLTVEKKDLLIALGSAGFCRTVEGNAIKFTVAMADEAKYICDYLKDFDSIAIIYMDNDYGSEWTEELKSRLGEKVVETISYELNETDFTYELTEIKDASPDVLVLLSGTEGDLIGDQARSLGIDAKFASTRAIERPEIISDPIFEGLVYSCPSVNTSNPFFTRYIENYGNEPTIFGAEAYDAIITLSMAIDECGREINCIYDWYLGREYNGALGSVSFDESGDAHYPVILKEIRNGEAVPFELSQMT
jgi:branched-chain amino acid transport system substrate-binding protein